MTPRVTLLTTPPVVGRIYLVPTVTFPWHDRVRDWPVFLPRHEDAEHLNFSHGHYHIDPRFVGGWDWRFAMKHNYRRYWHIDKPDYLESDAFAAFQAQPLNRIDMTLPPVGWKALRCRRVEIPYQFGQAIAEKLTPHFIGRQCRTSKTGWICPHKRVPLGSFAPVDGIITCPLHGLQIDATSGKVVGPVLWDESQIEEAAA